MKQGLELRGRVSINQKQLWLTEIYIVAVGFPVKSGPVLVPESSGPDLSPHPPNPDEVGADIVSNELWPSRDNILLSSTFNLVCSIYVTPSLIRPHARASKQTNLANLRALSAS